jgi:hypothetical protein
MVNQMVAIGEESGALDSMLGKVADFFEAEVDDAVEALSSLMEPIIMVVLGVLIGGMVIAMYLPIFKLGASSDNADRLDFRPGADPVHLPLRSSRAAGWQLSQRRHSSFAEDDGA